jgi:hypothetical protein
VKKITTDSSTNELLSLRDACEDIAGNDSGYINTKLLGNFINKYRDKVLDGLKLEHAGTYQRAVK